eukprot:5087341-Alexandrium_andersonii.AAC.1
MGRDGARRSSTGMLRCNSDFARQRSSVPGSEKVSADKRARVVRSDAACSSPYFKTTPAFVRSLIALGHGPSHFLPKCSTRVHSYISVADSQAQSRWHELGTRAAGLLVLHVEYRCSCERCVAKGAGQSDEASGRLWKFAVALRALVCCEMQT